MLFGTMVAVTLHSTCLFNLWPAHPQIAFYGSIALLGLAFGALAVLLDRCALFLGAVLGNTMLLWGGQQQQHCAALAHECLHACMRRPVVVVATAFSGAFAAAYGVGHFAGHFPTPAFVQDAVKGNVDSVSTWVRVAPAAAAATDAHRRLRSALQTWVYLGAIAALWLTGVVVQLSSSRPHSVSQCARHALRAVRAATADAADGAHACSASRGGRTSSATPCCPPTTAVAPCSFAFLPSCAPATQLCNALYIHDQQAACTTAAVLSVKHATAHTRRRKSNGLGGARLPVRWTHAALRGRGAGGGAAAALGGLHHLWYGRHARY